jgi:phosphatidylglycerophosphate synthase
VTRLAVALGIGPNALTLLSGLVGLGAAWCFWRASPASALAGLLAYLAAVVLDHADGEVARLTLSESALGEWLDVAGDTLVHAGLVVAIGETSASAAGGRGAPLGAIAAAGIVASAALAKFSPQTGATGEGRVGRVLASLGNRDGFYGMLVTFLVLLAAWPSALPALMAVVAAGAHAYWLGRALHLRAQR